MTASFPKRATLLLTLLFWSGAGCERHDERGGGAATSPQPLAAYSAEPIATPSPTPSLSEAERYEPKRISPEEAKKMVDSGKGVLVDVRSAESHRLQSIPGSLSYPEHELEAKRGTLPKDADLIFYCT